MERHSVFMGWKTHEYVKSTQNDLWSTWCILNSNSISINISARFFVDISNFILKWIAKTVLNKKKECGNFGEYVGKLE